MENTKSFYEKGRVYNDWQKQCKESTKGRM